MPSRAKRNQKQRTPLTKERVLDAALRFADEHGIDSLSMRNLGQALGVEAMSLYKHVANKDDILDGIVDLVVAEITVPKVGGNWKQEMRGRALSAHAVLMKHRWATMLIVSRANVGPSMLRYVDATIGALIEAGFSYPLADHASNAIDSYVYGFTLHLLNFPFQPEEYAAAAKQYLPMIPRDLYPYFYGLGSLVAEEKHDGINKLEFGLDLLLDGLDRLRRKS